MQLFDNSLSSYGIPSRQWRLFPCHALRISADQPALHKATARLLCLGSDSANQELATRYLEHAITHLSSYAGTYAFMDSQPLMRENLDKDIDEQKQRIDKTRNQLNRGGLSASRQKGWRTS